jgi:aspartate racemase
VVSFTTITGNGPDSGMMLWKAINSHFTRILGDHFLGDISLPRVYVVSAPAMGLSMELDKRDDATWNVLSEAVLQLKSQGAEILALACHTTHYYTDRIRKLFEDDGRKFISMAEETIKYIHKEQIEDLAILGVSFAADLGEYSAYSELKKLQIEDISADTLKKFHDWGYTVKKIHNVHTPLQSIKNVLKGLESNNVLIALTELSILYESQKSTWDSIKNIIDPLDIYARVIAEESLKGQAFEEES